MPATMRTTLSILVMAASGLALAVATAVTPMLSDDDGFLAAAQPCPAGFTCYEDGPSFVSALNKGASKRLALLCTAAKRCTISNARLYVDFDIDLQMAYVDLKDKDIMNTGGLMMIGGNIERAGSVIGTGLSFSGGRAAYGGAVGIDGINGGGNFTCIDCIFRNNSASMYGGGGAIKNVNGMVNLIRPTFSDNTPTGPNAMSGLCACTGAGCLSSCVDPNTREGAFFIKLRTTAGGEVDLICTAESRCTISGVQLFVGVETTVNMAYVDVMNHSAAETVIRTGGLMFVAGVVTGTGLTFSGGTADGVGGAVYIQYGGVFSCSDCTFRDNTARADSGPISNVHTIVLKDPTFVGNSPSVETNCHESLISGSGGCTCTGQGCPSCCK